MNRSIESQRTSSWPLLVVAVSLGCTRTPPVVAEARDKAIEAPAAPETRPKPKPKPKPEPIRWNPDAVIRSVAQRWCETGGEQFAAPGGDPDEYPPPLSSCDDVATEISSVQRLGSVSTAILEVDAIFESREVLLFHDGTANHTFDLTHDFEDESGEGGEYTRTYDAIELRDVYGDPTPEWIATKTLSGGDSFEADRCYAHDSTVIALVVCTLGGEALRCFEVNTTNYEDSRPRTADQLYDCEEPPPPDDITRNGYALGVRIEAGAAVFTRLAKPKIDEAADPPYEGRVSLDTLFEEHPAEL